LTFRVAAIAQNVRTSASVLAVDDFSAATGFSA